MYRLNSPDGYTLSVHSVRRRLCDVDGASVKASLDGLVCAKLLEDDSPKQIKKVEFTQSRCKDGEDEKTLLTFTRIDK